MKAAALTIALLLSGAAFAQTDASTDVMAYEGDGVATAAWETDSMTASTATADASAAGVVVEPSNANPERDARGIAVISDAAVTPAGWNGTAAGSAMGGPELDPATGEPAAPQTYPACTATVTDNCLQTYERGRKR
ncbi:MAG TPA: hypothetical protein VIT45_08345 [Allosphingosinicella sp.]